MHGEIHIHHTDSLPFHFHYILNEYGDPEVCDDILRWSMWFEHDERRVTRQQHWDADGRSYTVSTVFLGLDHNWRAHGPPVLWETMVFIDGEDEETQRYTSREEAILGHNVIVARYGGVPIG